MSEDYEKVDEILDELDLKNDAPEISPDIIEDTDANKDSNLEASDEDSPKGAPDSGFPTAINQIRNASLELLEDGIDTLLDSLKEDLWNVIVESSHDNTIDELSGEDILVSEMNGTKEEIEALLTISESVPTEAVEYISEAFENAAWRVQQLYRVFEQGDLQVPEGQAGRETVAEKILETVENVRKATHDILQNQYEP